MADLALSLLARPLIAQINRIEETYPFALMDRSDPEGSGQMRLSGTDTGTFGMTWPTR